MVTKPKITAKQLVALLATRHSKDIFVAECKTGPSTGVSGMQILDAWAAERSWANPLVSGYEVKVARSDFLRDDKWRGYLPYCHAFSFVTPPGTIQPEELPAEVGLVVCSTNATRLYTKKKAPYRDLVIPDSLLWYVLFSRATIAQEQWTDETSKATFWQDWLAGKRELKHLGTRIGRTLRERIKEEILDRDSKQRRLGEDIENLRAIKRMLVELGYVDRVPDEWEVKQNLERLSGAVPRETIRAISKARDALETVEKELQAIHNQEQK